MKRRRFVQNLLAAPVTAGAAAAGAAAAQQAAPPPTVTPPHTTPEQTPHPQANTPARQMPMQPQQIPQLTVTQVDVISETEPHYFTPEQFATLRKLGEVLVPPVKGQPGALDAQAPEFLDFLISVSPADRQALYRNGLEELHGQAAAKYQKPFAELDKTQVDALVRPLLVARFWPQELPTDPMKNFMAQVHEDLRTATANSHPAALVSEHSGRRGRGYSRTSGLYWRPIDPIVKD